jgi:hypothetical protein
MDFILETGYWTSPYTPVCKYTNEAMIVSLLNKTKDWIEENHSCEDMMAEAAMLGFKRNSIFGRSVIPDWEKCAMNLSCIAPLGSTLGNHRFDQSALALLMLYKYGLTTEHHDDQQSTCCTNEGPGNPTQQHDNIFFHHRRLLPYKPYHRYLCYDKKK